MAEFTGWLLDIYEDAADGLALWALADDGRRLRLRRTFAVRFYAAGPDGELRRLWQYLRAQPIPVRLSRTERQDLFHPGLLPVLAVEVPHAPDQPRLFQSLQDEFPRLNFYDADLNIWLRFAAETGAFPLARCRFDCGAGGRLLALEVLDSPWDLDPAPAPLRTLTLAPDCDPTHAEPRFLEAAVGGCRYRLAFEPLRPLLVNLSALIQRHDPDILLTSFGDTWLLPRLLEASSACGVALPLNREFGRGTAHRKARSYFSYGQVVYRGPQVLLFGRWHIDRRNAMLWDDYDLEGVLEAARVTAQPVQAAARTSPGSGISSMQMLTALRGGVLVPWHKQEAERPKSALDLLRYDQGGLVYQPITGLHSNVGEVDFISMYPSIMVHANISPETTRSEGEPSTDQPPGLIPRTLEPLLNKRIALKQRLAEMAADDPLRPLYQVRASAHKWLLVTCFGYLGYKNARFGRIESHEAVTNGGREALLAAKEAAERQGFEVLHLYVDGMWLKREGTTRVSDYTPLLEEISRRTGLPIALDGIFRWVAFLPSRVNEAVPVPNRYFGVFQDGSIKTRGIEARRRDSPPFIAEAQMELLTILARGKDAAAARALIPEALTALRRRIRQLREGRAPLEKLLVGQKLSRELEKYRSPSPAAQAAAQLQAAGKRAEPGQRLYFVYLRGGGVHAWDLPTRPDPRGVDSARYIELLLRAAETVLCPFGISAEAVRGVEPGRLFPLPSRRGLSGGDAAAAGRRRIRAFSGEVSDVMM